MENKNLKFVWVAIGLIVVALVWVAVWGNKTTVVLNDKGQVVGAVSGPELPNPSCINGLCTYVASADFKDATTTILSISMAGIPIPATATVDFLQLTNTGVATTSYQFSCGPAKSGAGDPDIKWVDVQNVATNTMWGTIFSAATSSNGWIGSSGSNRGVNMATSTSAVVVRPGEFFVCNAVGINGEAPLGNDGGWDSAFRNALNTFAGRFKVRFNYSTY